MHDKAGEVPMRKLMIQGGDAALVTAFVGIVHLLCVDAQSTRRSYRLVEGLLIS